MDGLFEIEPSPKLVKGDKVTIQTIWGTEPATVVDVLDGEPYPMVKVTTKHGDTISIDVARVRHA